MPAVRPGLLERSAADPDHRLFALYLPGAELTLHASVHSAPVALLIARGIRFAVHCDNNSGWAAGKSFMRSAQDEAWVTARTLPAKLARASLMPSISVDTNMFVNHH